MSVIVPARRAWLGLAAAGLALPALVLAQPARVPRVAVLFIGDSDDDEPAARPFFQKMEKLGWIEGKTIQYERHSGRGTRQYLETMVGNATGAEPDLVFATTGALAAAVLKDKPDQPVVFMTMADPVAAKLVASFEKPGGSASGAYQVPGDAAPKRFSFIKQAMPGLKRMGSVYDRSNAESMARREAHQKAAKAAGLELSTAEFTNFEAIARIFANFKKEGLTAAEMTPSFALTGRRREVVALAERNGLALFAHRAEWADAGAVLTYGVDLGESYRRAAKVAHRILKGAKPAEVPVERARRYELVANAKAALALGIALPKPLLQQASRVIT